MNCPRCGDVCICSLELLPDVSPGWRSEDSPIPATTSFADEQAGMGLPQSRESSLGAPIAVENPIGPQVKDAAASPDSHDEHAPAAADESAWRDELSARLQRYRSRRKIQPPRYPSLRLQFDTELLAARERPVDPAPAFQPVSNRALALDHVPAPPSQQSVPVLQVENKLAQVETALPVVHQSPHGGAKIIEFPRFTFEPPTPPPDQLAEPVVEGLRILEAPEVLPPPPALGGITIEPAQRQEIEKRLGIDIPLQTASLARRIFAGLVDGFIVSSAAAAFGIIFWKVAAVRPPQAQLLGIAAGITCLFWAVFQYLLIVYAGGTPGTRAAGLELTRFDGSATSRSSRRWRVIASYLSAASLGMGYIWVFLDEDVLCWHDRTTHTYLAPKNPKSRP